MKIGIIGAGKIGKALGDLAEDFCDVVYVDVVPPYSNDYQTLLDADILFICVNTTDFEEYNTSNVSSCLKQIKDNQIESEVVVVSTCPPSFFDQNHDIDFVYSPLFIRQGTIKQDIIDAELVLIGTNSKDLKLFDFYSHIRSDYNYQVTSPKEAAVVKMGINGFLCLKVAYANMIGDFCVENELNPDIVLEAISNCKSVNSHYFRYGSGYGGPCLPIDNRTLSKEIKNDWPLRTDRANEEHLKFQFENFKANNKIGRYVFEKVSYKENVPMIIASQKLALAAMLANDGYDIVIKDSQEVCDLIELEHPALFSFETL